MFKKFLSKFVVKQYHQTDDWRLAFTIESKKESSLLNIAGFGRSFWITTPKLFSGVLYKDHGTWKEYLKRQYGFSMWDDSCFFYYGIYNDDWRSDDRRWNSKIKIWNYPWTERRRVRYDFYNPDGTYFTSANDKPTGAIDFNAIRQAENAVPKTVFTFNDYDGKLITATTHIIETEYRYGVGLWKFIMPLFRKNEVHRRLEISYDQEVGSEKGSWKGGTLGHSIEMRPGDTPLSAFTRYGTQETSFVKYRGQVPNNYTNIVQH